MVLFNLELPVIYFTNSAGVGRLPESVDAVEAKESCALTGVGLTDSGDGVRELHSNGSSITLVWGGLASRSLRA